MIRSLIFNLLYYPGTLTLGILIVPSLLLPEKQYLPFIRKYFALTHWLEKHILGLDYTIVGERYLPQGTPYIVAAKHQSAYETLKLPLLFDHPVVILKRELFQIPFWGWYARKAGNIGIDRSKPREAMAEMIQGVQKAASLDRTVIIFPQGTRVGADEPSSKKPYKRGIGEIYKTLNLPVVPLALNSGLFWPRNAFFKRAGTVTLKFLPPIPPGLDHDTFMKRLEQTLETESALLVEQTRETARGKKKKRTLANIALGLLASLILSYTTAWFVIAHIMTREITRTWAQAEGRLVILSRPTPQVTGYPGKLRILWAGTIETESGDVYVRDLSLSFWPLPYTPFSIDFPRGLHLMPKGDPLGTGLPPAALNIDRLKIVFEIPAYLPPVWTKPEVQKLYDQKTTYRLLNIELEGAQTGDLLLEKMTGSGELSYDEHLQPNGMLDFVFTNPEGIRDRIMAVVQHPMGKSFVTGAINALMRVDETTGEKTLPLTFTLKNGNVYAGPIKLAYIGTYYWPVATE